MFAFSVRSRKEALFVNTFFFLTLFTKESSSGGGKIIMNSRLIKLLGVSLVLCLVIGLTLMPVSNVDAYYGTGGYFGTYGYPQAYSSFGSLGTGLGYTSGLYGGLYGGLSGGYGGYGGLMGGLSGGYGGYGGLMGGLYGGYGGYGGLMGGLYGGYGGLSGGLYGGYGGLMGGLYGGYGGLMGGLYGGMMGGLSSMYSSPFGVQNLYYPVETTGGLTYQVPFMQIAPMLGIAGLYNQLFPNLFNPQPQLPPIVNVSTPATQFVTFPTPIGTIPLT
jgi:hypothetical protein